MEPSPEPSPPTTTTSSAAAVADNGDEPHPTTTTTTTTPTSLFPLFPLSSPTSAAAAGVSNPSFSFDASALQIPTAATSHLPPPSPSSSDELPASAAAEAPPKYELVPSSPSPASSEEERSSRRKERKRRKRKREKEGSHGAAMARKSGVRAWAGSETKPAAKDYYFDVKGDLDNLAFGCLYRMDIARYKRHSLLEVPGLKHLEFYHHRLATSRVDADADIDGLDSKLRAGGRYYSVKYATLERNKGFKHLKVIKKDTPAVFPEEFIPLESPSLSKKNENDARELEESWEDELLRRTREFNKMSRESPYDVKIWLAFAEFQDKVASTQPQKAARLQTIERKISILEKAVELNPDNEELLLCLLRAYGDRDSTENLLGKWEKILTQHSDSCKLWKEYLLVCQSDFSRFKVSDTRRRYAYAIQALSAAWNKLCRQDYQNADPHPPNSSIVQLEHGLVDIFVNLCRFEWQTGYREVATGLFQAQIEYSLFCPPLRLAPNNKQRLFEYFWNSGGARIGEDGALGWSTWLSKDEENRQSMVMQETSEEIEVGGWSGWFDPSLRNDGTNQVPEELVEPSMIDGDDEDNPDAEGAKSQDDVESLLRRLGIDIDVESNSEVKDAKTWNKWSVEELSRDNEQWMPLHETSGSASLRSDGGSANEDNDQLSRVVLFEEVTEFLFSLSSEEARFSLICQFIDFYGGKISRWTSTNSSSWLDKMLSLEMIPDDILDDLRVVSDLVNKLEHESHYKLESLLGNTNDLSQRAAMMKFLRNAILLCLDIFPRNHILEEAVLVSSLSMTRENSSSNSANTSRALAKNLLKKDRQDFLLCGIYARIEASHGNIDQARKIFDLALLSIEGAAKEKLPLLYFWYAEMELATSTSSDSSELSVKRAIYILSCLGSNVKYAPFTCPISRPQILRARQGFKEQIRSLRSTLMCGDIKEHTIALICSASLFESMTSGCSAGLEVIEEAFSMALPERSHSLEFERLWVYYIGLLRKHLSQLSLSRVWKSISQGIEIYPYNPKSFAAMLTLSCLYSVSNKVRLTLDKCCQRVPSIIVWLFALSFEWNKAGSDNRIHGLFERALADDKLQKSVLMWRCYLAYEAEVACNPSSARRVFFRAIHACPWSKKLWLDGFQKLSSILTIKELSDLHEVMRDKELHIRTDIYEILLQDETET